jgi:hypothetical protein
MKYAKTRQFTADFLNEEVIVEWFDEVVGTTSVTDDEIIANVLGDKDCADDSETDSETETGSKKITMSEGLELGDRYLTFLEQQKFVTPSELMFLQRLQDKISREKPILKQLKINDMFKR